MLLEEEVRESTRDPVPRAHSGRHRRMGRCQARNAAGTTFEEPLTTRQPSLPPGERKGHPASRMSMAKLEYPSVANRSPHSTRE